MNDLIAERVIESARHMIESGGTVRACAARFGVSKTTAHKDLRRRLPELNPLLAREVNALIKLNKDNRHLRGGEATKRKYAAEGREKNRST